MTSEEKKERIRDINSKINELRRERDEYENQLVKEKMSIELENRKKFVGKYFVINDELNKRMGNFVIGKNRAFYILNITDDEQYAKCIVLSSYMTDVVIKLTTLGLWTKVKLTNNESDPCVIDLYNEISREEFMGLYEEYEGVIEKFLE